MAGYRIRRGAQEFPVSDLDALVKLARDGRLAPEDPVWVGEEWVRADSLPALRPHLGADPWAIWEDAERLDAEAVYRAALVAGEQVADLTDEQLRPLMVVEANPQTKATEGPSREEPAPPQSWVPPPPPEARPTAPESPPEGGKEPAEEPAAPTRPGLSLVPGGLAHSDRRKPPMEKPRSERTAEGTEVIQFPRTARALPELPRSERRPPSNLRPLRLLTWLLVGVIVAMLGWVSLQLSRPQRSLVEDGIPPKNALPTPTPPSPVKLLEEELRRSLPASPRAIVEAGDLPDNLTVELQQMRVDIVTVDAVVTKWGGRKEDQPQSANISITIRPSPELERDMGAIGLVVGRYVTLYRLDVPVFEVVVIEGEQAAKRSFDPIRTSSFYEGNLSLEEWVQ